MADLRVAIVDDEPLVRSGLRSMLEAEREVTIVAEARNGSEALDAIRAKRPDVVFLDVQMPGMDGFEVLSAIDTSMRPAIVFVTAHDDYAIRAFDVHAVDYLLKPFDAERFRLALERARARLASLRGSSDSRLEALLSELKGRPRFADRLMLKDDGNVIVLLVADIDWVEAADNYVLVHAGNARYKVRQTISALERKLDPARFARTHRSAIVSLDRVRSLEPMAAGEYVITLSTGAKVPLSRSYRDDFRRRLEGRG